MAYATTAARVTGDTKLHRGGQRIVNEVMNTPGLSAETRGNALYKAAQSMWAKVNPSSVSSAWYARLAQAGLG